MAEPELVTVSRRIVETCSCAFVDPQTGVEVEHVMDCDDAEAEAVLLDMQSANLIAQTYDMIDDKTLFDRSLEKVGVSVLVGKLWGAVK